MVNNDQNYFFTKICNIFFVHEGSAIMFFFLLLVHTTKMYYYKFIETNKKKGWLGVLIVFVYKIFI